MVDAKYFEDEGLIACRDIKKDEIININYLDYIYWKNSKWYNLG